jgi:H+/gluconate symporter-like permease
VGVGARLMAEDNPSIGLVGSVGIGTIITSSSIAGSLDTGAGKRLGRSISNSSIRGIIRSIFSISIPDYPSYYIIMSLLETSSCSLSTISLVVSPTRFMREAILRRLFLRVSN